MTRILPVAAGLSALLAIANPVSSMAADPPKTEPAKTEAAAKTEAEAREFCR